MNTEQPRAKCGVIIDQSDHKDIECNEMSALTNEGVPLCVAHAVAYYREGLLTEASVAELSKLVDKHPNIYLFR